VFPFSPVIPEKISSTNLRLYDWCFPKDSEICLCIFGDFKFSPPFSESDRTFLRRLGRGRLSPKRKSSFLLRVCGSRLRMVGVFPLEFSFFSFGLVIPSPAAVSWSAKLNAFRGVAYSVFHSWRRSPLAWCARLFLPAFCPARPFLLFAVSGDFPHFCGAFIAKSFAVDFLESDPTSGVLPFTIGFPRGLRKWFRPLSLLPFPFRCGSSVLGWAPQHCAKKGHFDLAVKEQAPAAVWFSWTEVPSVFLAPSVSAKLLTPHAFGSYDVTPRLQPPRMIRRNTFFS